MTKRIFMLALILVLAVGLTAALLPSPAMAKGKPKPPPCGCAPTVGPCVLVECGTFDCVYQCPFP